ncbi:electron carrier [Agyrium rufum]|nr:electron carrier [Agyrium rufum]
MAPAVMLDTTSDFDFSPSLPPKNTSGIRTLLLSPPSLSSHPEKLNNVLEAHDRHATDLQMLDRLALSLVTLPHSTFDSVIILSDADGTRTESTSLLSRDLLARLVQAIKPNGNIRSQDGTFATSPDSHEYKEAILAGLIVADPNMRNGATKPSYTTESVPLSFSSKKQPQSTTTLASQTSPLGTGAVPLNLNGKRPTPQGASDTNGASHPAGVGFVDSAGFDSEDEGDKDEEELIDEDTLLDESDFSRSIIQPPSCRPKPGKRRRACKDCTCGLAQRMEAEDAAKRSKADSQLAKFQADELAEVDFTVQGKVGSCGNCALGDAFRCDGCPYIGLPAFKVGEEVRISLGDEGAL